MSDYIEPQVGDVWVANCGQGRVYEGKITKIEDAPSQYSNTKYYTLHAEVWKNLNTGQTLEHEYPGMGKTLSYVRSKDAKTWWTRISVANPDLKVSSFGDRIAKALRDDAWSMIDGRFKR